MIVVLVFLQPLVYFYTSLEHFLRLFHGLLEECLQIDFVALLLDLLQIVVFDCIHCVEDILSSGSIILADSLLILLCHPIEVFLILLIHP